MLHNLNVFLFSLACLYSINGGFLFHFRYTKARQQLAQ